MDNPDYKRDLNTNSISNTNISKYEEYISTRNSKIKHDKKVDSIKVDLDNMKDEISEIKMMLKKLTDGI